MARVLVLFDIDGTLLHGAGAGRAAMEDAFLRSFGRPGGMEAVETAGRTDRAIFGDMARRVGVALEPAAYARLLQAYADALPGALAAHGAGPLPGIPELVRALAGDDRCRLALGTGNARGSARAKVRHLGLEAHFPVGGFGDDAVERPAVIAAALGAARSHYGEPFEAASAVVVGDAPRDVEAARANGTRVLGVGTGRTGPAAIAEARPDVLFPDLRDTRRARAWILD
jgi:phosphoglycolate phosphatase-like HAD superfamily hydrolase